MSAGMKGLCQGLGHMSALQLYIFTIKCKDFVANGWLVDLHCLLMSIPFLKGRIEEYNAKCGQYTSILNF